MVDDEPRLLIPPEFYFQATCDVGYRDKLREQIEQGRHPERLTELPSLTFASQRTGQPPAVAVGWNDSGIAIEIRVSGKNIPGRLIFSLASRMEICFRFVSTLAT